jgi:hypothetical protein
MSNLEKTRMDDINTLSVKHDRSRNQPSGIDVMFGNGKVVKARAHGPKPFFRISGRHGVRSSLRLDDTRRSGSHFKDNMKFA